SICTEYWARAVPVKNAVNAGIAASAGNAKPKPSPKIFILASCCLLDGPSAKKLRSSSSIATACLRTGSPVGMSSCSSETVRRLFLATAMERKNPPDQQELIPTESTSRMLTSENGRQDRHRPLAQRVHAAWLASKGLDPRPDTAIQNLV